MVVVVVVVAAAVVVVVVVDLLCCSRCCRCCQDEAIDDELGKGILTYDQMSKGTSSLQAAEHARAHHMHTIIPFSGITSRFLISTVNYTHASA